MIYNNEEVKIGDIFEGTINIYTVLDVFTNSCIAQSDDLVTYPLTWSVEVMKAYKLNKISDGNWVPKMGQKYFYISDWGVDDCVYWDNDETDQYRLKTNNVFKTREEAIIHDRDHI